MDRLIMIKGWKNNPVWVAYYAGKKEREQQWRIEKILAEHKIAMLMQEADSALRNCDQSLLTNNSRRKG